MSIFVVVFCLPETRKLRYVQLSCYSIIVLLCRNVKHEADEMQLLDSNDAPSDTASAESKTSNPWLQLWLAKKWAAMRKLAFSVTGNLKLFARFAQLTANCYSPLSLIFLGIRSFGCQ